MRPTAEVSHVSSQGIWLLTGDKEFFMPYTEFPWFKHQTIKSVLNVKEQNPGHFNWPDIDLTLEAIEHPERFSLNAR